MRGGAENYILHFANKLDFVASETPGKLTLNCLLHCPYNLLLMYVSTVEIPCYCTALS